MDTETQHARKHLSTQKKQAREDINEYLSGKCSMGTALLALARVEAAYAQLDKANAVAFMAGMQRSKK